MKNNNIIWVYSSVWKPGFYKFHGKNQACWYRETRDKNFKYGIQTLSQFGISNHRPVKFWRVFRYASPNQMTNSHELLKRNISWDFAPSHYDPKVGYKKRKAKDFCEKIQYYSSLQDSLFSDMVNFLGINGNKLKEEWLFDAAFNGSDFDLIWDEKINK